MCGGRTLDLEALQAATSYEDGFTAASPVIRWFWEVRGGACAAQISFLTIITPSRPLHLHLNPSPPQTPRHNPPTPPPTPPPDRPRI